MSLMPGLTYVGTVPQGQQASGQQGVPPPGPRLGGPSQGPPQQGPPGTPLQYPAPLQQGPPPPGPQIVTGSAQMMRAPTPGPNLSVQGRAQMMGPPMSGQGMRRSHASIGGSLASAGRPPAAKKKKRLGDRLIPAPVRELVPECQAYMDLLNFEKKLDATIARKKLDIQEALKRPMKVKRRLRIYVSHTFFASKEPEKEGEEGSVAMWELRVEGRLLDDSPAPGGSREDASQPPPQQPPSASGKSQTKKKFSSFFKSLVIELDKDIYGPDNHLVEWHRTPTTNETDGFQVKRPGDRNTKCTILLLLDHQPMKFKLNNNLAKLLGVHTETRPKIIEALWQYVKTHKLQDPHERDHINCDQYLEKIFQCRRMRFMEIPQRLQNLLTQPDPIVINHMITVEGTDPKKTACYDIDVEIEDPLKVQMTQFTLSQAQHQDISTLDNKIYEAVDQVNEMKTRRDFYLGFSTEPQEFIQKWLASQARDLRKMTEVEGQPEVERRADFYHQPWMQESVCRYFYRKVQQKRAELDQSLGIRNN